MPSPKAYLVEIADFWEVQAIRNPGQYISVRNISRAIANGSDELEHDGIESEDDILDSKLEDVLRVFERRAKFAAGKYPFSCKDYSIILSEEEGVSKDVYLFLLLCTRFDMKKQKVQGGVDATQIFEELCACVAGAYFGESAKSYVFGTAHSNKFEDKVNELIKCIGEGGGFKNPNDNPPTKNDDSIDVVAWKDFADERRGKLIAFGQCKTGTSWHDDIQRLKPIDFCDNWFSESPIVAPLPLVFIADTLDEQMNFDTVQKGYLFFNRFRIVEMLPDALDASLYEKIRVWLQNAIKLKYFS